MEDSQIVAESGREQGDALNGAEPEEGRGTEDEVGRRGRHTGRRIAAALERADRRPRLVTTAQLVRRLLPGDSEFGDPLSTAGEEAPHAIARRLSALGAERPSALGELGLGALQVWQSLSEAQGRGRGPRELAILFTDLVHFSRWALEAGDTAAIELLREVGRAIEPPVRDRDGKVVKRLGDGLMAVFDEPGAAVHAALDARERLGTIEVEGFRPRLRAGVHVGRPRRLGSDYLGVDVNTAARVGAAAGDGEVLVSGPACERLEAGAFELKRRRRFKASGAPSDLEVYIVESAAGG
jgi:adenylate cyclase